MYICVMTKNLTIPHNNIPKLCSDKSTSHFLIIIFAKQSECASNINCCIYLFALNHFISLCWFSSVEEMNKLSNSFWSIHV